MEAVLPIPLRVSPVTVPVSALVAVALLVLKALAFGAAKGALLLKAAAIWVSSPLPSLMFVGCAHAWLPKPKAIAMVDAKSVFFMIFPITRS